MIKFILTGLLITLSAIASWAQYVDMGSYDDLKQRFGGLFQSASVGYMWTPTIAAGNNQGLQVAPVDVYLGYNEGYPALDWGDGALWQGKGLNSRLQAGGRWRNDFLDISFIPQVGFEQNQSFDMPTAAEYAEYGATASEYGDFHYASWDHPLRMGGSSIAYFDFGQTRAKAFYGPLFLSAGTENRIWGASRYNSALLSANGAGVPSVELGLDPCKTDWGTWEAHLIYGQLKASGYEYDNGKGGTRLWSGLFGAWSPAFYPALTFGIGRTVTSYWSALNAQDFVFPLLPGLDFGIDKYDQRMSLSFKIHEPSVGLEIYGEWARNDYTSQIRMWLENLEHTQAWVLGLRKGFDLGSNGQLAFEAELGVFSIGEEMEINYNGYQPYGGDFYTHTIILEGYTIGGQDLGAACGNGNYQMLTGVWLTKDLIVKTELKRWVKDYSILIYEAVPGYEHNIDVVYDLSTSCDYKVQDWNLGLTLGGAMELNRYFVRGSTDYSLYTALKASYRFK